MKSRPPFLSVEQDAIEARAAAWLAQRDDALTAEERAEFDRWQEADPRHAEAVARLAKAWTALQQLREFRPAARVHPDPDVLLGAKRSAKIISFPRLAAAAALAAAIAIAAMLGWRLQPVSAQAVIEPVYATTAGGYQRVTLEDGSVLELNANSRVRVQFTAAVRHVALERGEAHFTVAKNPARPFIVQAQSVSVRAVGTAFNVRLEERGVEVLVTEGRVQVRDQGQAVAALPELGAGQRLMVSTTEAAIEPPAAEALAPEVMQESLAWQGPRLRFVDTPLASVVAQFNRRNQLQLELGDASLVNLPVDGSFRAEHVKAFVRLLESNGTIHADRVGEGRIILRRAR